MEIKLEKILNEIDNRVSELNTHRNYSESRKAYVYGAVHSEATRHSVGIEFKVEKSHGKTRRVRRIQSIRRLEQTRNYLAKNGIGIGSLSVLGHLVEPEGNAYENFRRAQVHFGRFAPPASEKVIFYINELVETLKMHQLHPVTRAVEAHLEIVRIHPYEDGNGRAARLLQNFCLEQRAYPPALIQAEDRDTYLKLLGFALDDRYSRKSSVYEPSNSELRFHEFIASRVLDSTIKIQNDLKNRNMYAVEFSNGIDRPVIHALANRIRNKGRTESDKGLSVRINPKSEKPGFAVTGAISLRELRNALEKSKPAKKSGYKIKKV